MNKLTALLVTGLLTATTVEAAAPRSAVRVVTHVVNDDGGTAVASDWLANGAPGSETGVTFELKQGQVYDIRSTALPGYATSSVGCLFKAKPGTTYLCQFTHDDIPPPPGTLGDCGWRTLQAAIDAAVDGDVIRLPEGFCVWDTNVSLSNKNIAIIGAGIDRTIIRRDGSWVFYTHANQAGKGRIRISGMTLTGDTTGAVIGVATSSYPGVLSGWRIDHIKFDYPTLQRTGIFIAGVTYGLIDHNEFRWAGGAAVLVAAFLSAECNGDIGNPAGNFIASQPLDLGTANAVYMEDNVFRSTGFSPINVYDTSAGGGRAVFRYNHVEGGFYYSHWTRGCEIGGVLHEVYRNTWVGNADYAAYPFRFESGTGVVFGNAIQNYNEPDGPFAILDDRRAIGGGEPPNEALGACDGTKPWDGNLGDPAAPGWPCLGQVGRAPGKTVADIMAGDKQASSPFYFWGNGREPGCATGGECTDVLGVFSYPAAYVRDTPHPNGDVDYVNHMARPGYVPFAYPHPLVQP